MKRTVTCLMLAAIAAGGVLLPSRAGAQGIESSLQQIGVDNARLYSHPLTSGLGGALNSGFYHTAKVHRTGGFDFGVRAMGAFIPDVADTFVPILPGSVSFGNQTFQDPYRPVGGGALVSPTVLGKGGGLRLEPQGAFAQALTAAGENPGAFDLVLPQGFDFPAVPLAVAQVNVGLALGTEALVRFIPTVRVGNDIGAISLFGFGVKHSIDQWIPGPTPLNLALQFGYQTLHAGSYLDARAVQGSLIASRDLGLLTLYGAGGLEKTTVDVSYTVRNPAGLPGLPADGQTLSFSDEADGHSRLTVGSTLNLILLNLNVNYSFAHYSVLSADVLFSFR